MDISSSSRSPNSETRIPQNAEWLVFEVLHRLAVRLPSNFTYHSFEHTAEVISYSELFAKADSRTERELLLIRVAAVFHDIGFLVDRMNHEEVGAELASALLLHLETFSSEESEVVSRIILDTKVFENGQWNFSRISTPLSIYLLDADLSNFGRPQFMQKVELVRKELNLPASKSFYCETLEMLDRHSWHTRYAMDHLEQQKQSNRSKLLKKIATLKK